MRRASRTDDNQKEIVSTLRQIGCSIATTHTLGKGFPDIVVGCFGFNLLMEIKDGKKPLSARKLTPDEESDGTSYGMVAWTLCTIVMRPLTLFRNIINF